MKKIGLVGGISWTSTVDYYRFINEEANARLGDLDFAECIIYSVNFNHFRKYNAQYDWDATARLLTDAAVNLQKAGADILVLCANTAHIVADKVSSGTGLPLVDVRDAVAKAILQKGIKKAGLLGTVYTMEMDFYRNRLAEQGVETIIPELQQDRDYIEETLVHELGKGILSDTTRAAYVKIAEELVSRGAEGIILGCTEIPLLLSQKDISVPVFNSTHIHAQAAVELALKEN